MKIRAVLLLTIISVVSTLVACEPSRGKLEDRVTQTAFILPGQVRQHTDLLEATRTQAYLDYLSSRPTVTPTKIVTLSATIAVSPSPTPSSRCPAVNMELMPPDFEAIEDEDMFHKFEQDYLEYFNNGGTIANLPVNWKPDYQLDLTNDGVDELVIERKEFMIFSCVNGEYVTLFKLPVTAYLSSPIFIEARDANMNGAPEFIVIVNLSTQGGASFNVFEWNGHEIESIIDPASPYANRDGDTDSLCGPKGHFLDFDQDGLLDFVIEGQVRIWSTYRNHLPWREETHIYSWDGSKYAFLRRVLGAPQYRFQAVHDGDYAASLGEFNEALALFQEAIFSDELEWWSPERRKNEQEIWDAGMTGEPTPTLPAPDPDEYAYLASYSRYRIMQLHIIQGWLDEAQVVLANLQEFYPPGEPGSEFAELSEIFMNEYLSSTNMSDACVAVIEEAEHFEEVIVFYLGDYHHGIQTGDYQLKDICPY